MSDIYKRKITFEFEFENEILETDGWILQPDGGKYLEWSETERNGHEDTHIGGDLWFENETWVTSEPECHQDVDNYRYDGWLADLITFLNNNPPPEAEGEE
jgi:hypothetical protein